MCDVKYIKNKRHHIRTFTTEKLLHIDMTTLNERHPGLTFDVTLLSHR